MTSRSAIAGLLLCALAGSAPAVAPPTPTEPERLLPASSLAYLRWDGVSRHKDAYKNSAFGKAMAEGLGRPARVFWEKLETEMKVGMVGEKMLTGATPDALRRQSDLITALKPLPGVLAETGFAASLDASLVPPAGDLFGSLGKMLDGKGGPGIAPLVQLTFVFPGAGKRPEVRTALDRLAAFTKEGAKKLRVRDRDVIAFPPSRGNMGWAAWMEGDHLVVVGTLNAPELAVNRVLNAGDGITAKPLYKALLARKGMEVTTRGYVDGKAVQRLAEAVKLFDSRAVAGLEGMGFLDVDAFRIWEGFDGALSRSVWEVDLGKKRRGGAGLLVKKSLDLKSLPPLPDDAYRWVAGKANLPAAYDLVVAFAATVSGSRRFAPADKDAFAQAKEQAREELEKTIGFDPRTLTDALGDTFIAYASPSEGLPFFGQVYLLEVKDEKKVARVLDVAIRRAAANARGGGEVRRDKFHGAVIRHLAMRNNPFTPTFTVYKGWLVMGLQPQAVQGFVLRSQGKLARWAPDELTAKALAAVPKDAGLVQVSDPRPVVKVWLSAVPLFFTLPFRGRGPFVVPSDVPHGGAAAKHLHTNVAWTSFDGKTWRLESRGSVVLPLEGAGTEWIFLLGTFARFAI